MQRIPPLSLPHRIYAGVVDDEGRIAVVKEFEETFRDSNINLARRVVPQRLLVQFLGQNSKVSIESGPTPGTCKYYFGQLSFGKEVADGVRYEPQLDGRPYHAIRNRDVSEGGKLAK